MPENAGVGILEKKNAVKVCWKMSVQAYQREKKREKYAGKGEPGHTIEKKCETSMPENAKLGILESKNAVKVCRKR